MKEWIQKLFHTLGYEIHRRRAEASVESRPTRGSLEGSLDQVRTLGFSPTTVIDVGAAFGNFSRICHAVFPQAQYLLIEPLEEYIPHLSHMVAAIPGMIYEIAAAGADEGTVALHVHHDLVGSSLYRETEEGTDINGLKRDVRSVTLDRIVKKHDLRPPYLLKVDVQGGELDVLRGGQAILDGAEFVLLEVSLFQFFQDGPVFPEVVTYMESRGFVPYDILGFQYRPLDRALSQVDVAFVKKSGLFRRHHFYATPVQRHEQNRRFRSSIVSSLPSERAQ